MFDQRNSHLNLFKSWNQQDLAALDGEPGAKETQTVLENNLTRALAITLEREPRFAVKFAQLIERAVSATGRSQPDLAGQALEADTLVNIEVPIGQFDGVELDPALLIPVVITAEIAPLNADDAVQTAAVRARIDLVVSCGGYLLVVECKRAGRSALSAAAQLRGYLQFVLGPEAAAAVLPLVTMSWQDILLEAQRLTTASHTHDSGGSLLSDFVDYLGASSGALGWEGDLRSFAELCATPPAHRNPIWRSAVSQRMEDWTRQVADSLGGGSIDASVISQRWCVRLDWGWAREINVRLDCGNGLFLERQEWERSEGVHPVGIEAYLTLGDTLGQMALLSPELDPWQVGGPEWTLKGFIGFMHFQGRGIYFVPIAREQSSHAWRNRRQILRRYLRAEVPNPPFPPDAAWDTCRETWVRYWSEGRKGFVVLTARVELHRAFAITQSTLPLPATMADTFTDLRRRIGATPKAIQS